MGLIASKHTKASQPIGMFVHEQVGDSLTKFNALLKWQLVARLAAKRDAAMLVALTSFYATYHFLAEYKRCYSELW